MLTGDSQKRLFSDGKKTAKNAGFQADLPVFVLTRRRKMEYNTHSFFIFAPAFLFLLPSLRKKAGVLFLNSVKRKEESAKLWNLNCVGVTF
jgi:hypothetical protein